MKTTVLCLDENLLDLNLLKYKFDELFGDTNALLRWKNKLNELSGKLSLVDKCNQINTLIFDALDSVANEHQKHLISYEKEHFLIRMSQLPLRKDVLSKIYQSEKEGYQIKIVTSKSSESLISKFSNAGAESLMKYLVHSNDLTTTNTAYEVLDRKIAS